MLWEIWLYACTCRNRGFQSIWACFGVGVVTVSKRGPLRLYRLNAKELKPVHDWVKTYERFWTHQLNRIKERAEQKMASQLANQLTKPEEKN
jgi:hypothetical protein